MCNAVITIAIQLRYDYDPTTTYRERLLPFGAIRREPKMNMSIFRRSRVVVVSQSKTEFELTVSCCKTCCIAYDCLVNSFKTYIGLARGHALKRAHTNNKMIINLMLFMEKCNGFHGNPCIPPWIPMLFTWNFMGK